MFFKKECIHKTRGYRGQVPYMVPRYINTDGIGRIHLSLYATCDKCGKEYLYAMMHLDRALRELCQHSAIRSEIQEIIDKTPLKK